MVTAQKRRLKQCEQRDEVESGYAIVDKREAPLR